jgi:hypothetical protein
MRKQNVFGRKTNQTRPFYLIIIIFAIVLPGYFLIQNYHQALLDDLKQQEIVMQGQINALLNSDEAATYHEIGEILPYLPNDFSEIMVASELEAIKNVSGLALATNYAITFTPVSVSPFKDPLPTTIRYVKVQITMTISDPLLIMDYLDAIIDADTIYYIETLNVAFIEGGSAMVSLTLYTFYNAVTID